MKKCLYTTLMHQPLWCFSMLCRSHPSTRTGTAERELLKGIAHFLLKRVPCPHAPEKAQCSRTGRFIRGPGWLLKRPLATLPLAAKHHPVLLVRYWCDSFSFFFVFTVFLCGLVALHLERLYRQKGLATGMQHYSPSPKQSPDKQK